MSLQYDIVITVTSPLPYDTIRIVLKTGTNCNTSTIFYAPIYDIAPITNQSNVDSRPNCSNIKTLPHSENVYGITAYYMLGSVETHALFLVSRKVHKRKIKRDH